jgi:membrane-anchored glycerophosphoryl diester phosphodiesterase (GDPDase)
MDYGYQLLRHVVQQVFGNLRQAAQLTLLLFLLPLAGFIALGGATMGLGMTEPPGGGLVFGLLLLVVTAVVAYCWAAVGWHRYVLLEETGNGILPNWRGDRIRAYFGRTFIVGLIVILAVLGGGIVIGIVVAVTQSPALAIVLGIGLVFGASWVATRVGLVLPAAALGERMTIGESWAVTRPVASQILLPLIVIALVVGVIQQLILVIFGQTVTVDMFGTMQEQIVLSLPGQILNGVVSWLQLLLNLALMTTLYGNLIEGRQLN